jgi:sialic acid synthase SpsE
MVIVDLGSGWTSRNDCNTVDRMLLALAAVDPQRKATVKWQLFQGGEPQCVELKHDVFEYAFDRAEKLGYRTTASVFDKPSLDYLLTFDVPFIKLANRAGVRVLAKYVPRGIPIVYSYIGDFDSHIADNDKLMACVSDYPATMESYEAWFEECDLREGISDHTVGLDLWRKYRPAVYEKHMRLPDSTGPDAGPFAALPEELKECSRE